MLQKMNETAVERGVVDAEQPARDTVDRLHVIVLIDDDEPERKTQQDLFRPHRRAIPKRFPGAFSLSRSRSHHPTPRTNWSRRWRHCKRFSDPTRWNERPIADAPKDLQPRLIDGEIFSKRAHCFGLANNQVAAR